MLLWFLFFFRIKYEFCRESYKNDEIWAFFIKWAMMSNDFKSNSSFQKAHLKTSSPGIISCEKLQETWKIFSFFTFGHMFRQKEHFQNIQQSNLLTLLKLKSIQPLWSIFGLLLINVVLWYMLFQWNMCMTVCVENNFKWQHSLKWFRPTLCVFICICVSD